MRTELIDRLSADLLSQRPVVCLLGGPYLVMEGSRTGIPDGCQRLLAFLALCGGRAPRSRAAGLLWPEVEEGRAAGNLRSVLWRLRASGAGIVESDKDAVWLRRGVGTDVASVHNWASRDTGSQALPDELQTLSWHPEMVDLLPRWDDEWIVFERERLRQHVLHALEWMVALLVKEGRYAEGIEAALLAVEIEPLRESAQRRLVEAHLAEGNVWEAHRVLQIYEELLGKELGIRPSHALTTLVPGFASANKH